MVIRCEIYRLLHCCLVKATGDMLITGLYGKCNFTHYQKLTLFGLYYLINKERYWRKQSKYTSNELYTSTVCVGRVRNGDEYNKFLSLRMS